MKKVLAILTLGLFAAGAFAQAPAAEATKEPVKVEKSTHKSTKTHGTKHTKPATPAKSAAQ
ncbi:hypothetical protein P3W85_36390 [Cupriavidus basilensis]|uniref:Acid-shock protein n=1 Tax=Cupriavidus basilensis TaxID=68895 RepID=A0ABT6B0F8_9BURK|nr:hypothetical protein [Cupriavidus basilensis]MDF3838371.1 hypothetical protein [Cupriavidus basilensis]